MGNTRPLKSLLGLLALLIATPALAAPTFCTGTTQVVSSGSSVPGSFLLTGTGSSGNCVEAGDKIFGAFSVNGSITGAGSSVFDFQMTPGDVTIGFQGSVAASTTGGVDYSVAVDPMIANGFLIDNLEKDLTYNANPGTPATATLNGLADGVSFTCTRSTSATGVVTSDCPVTHIFPTLLSALDVTESVTAGANTIVTGLTDTISQVPSVSEPGTLALLSGALFCFGALIGWRSGRLYRVKNIFTSTL